MYNVRFFVLSRNKMPLIVEQLKDKTNPSRLMFNLTKISKFSTTIRKLTWITRIKFHRPFRSFLYFTTVQNKIEYHDRSTIVNRSISILSRDPFRTRRSHVPFASRLHALTSNAVFHAGNLGHESGYPARVSGKCF